MLKKSRTVLLIIFSFIVAPGAGFFAETAYPEQQAKPGGAAMNTYVIFFSFTQQGMQHIKDSPKRVRDAKEIVKSMGGEVKEFYGILGGKYDTMFIVQAANDEAVARMALAVAGKGNVSTSTHRLFTEAEYDKVIGSLP